MKAQVANNMMSSFLAFLDNRILDRGEAFTNHSSQLYELSQGVHVTIQYGERLLSRWFAMHLSQMLQNLLE